MKILLILSYLLAIVFANLIVTKFGAAALPLTALLIIPFDLIARDQLHEMWSQNRLKIKMFLLVLSGSVISYALNADAVMVATASCLSFFVAGAADFAVYSFLKYRAKHEKMIYSNLVSGTIDSFLFQFVAFGSITISIALRQTLFKATGTFIWTFLFLYVAKKFKKK